MSERFYVGRGSTDDKSFLTKDEAIQAACDLVKTIPGWGAAVSVLSPLGVVLGVAIDDANGCRFMSFQRYAPAVPAFEHGGTVKGLPSKAKLDEICSALDLAQSCMDDGRDRDRGGSRNLERNHPDG